MMRSKHVNILGAGQCGTLLATMLAQNEFSVSLYERNGDPRGASAAAGRSINLALASRGINALRKAGVLERVQPLLVPMRGRMVHAVDGSMELLPYGQRDDEQIYSASRGELNKILLDAAEQFDNVEIRFAQAALSYHVSDGGVQMHDFGANNDYEIETVPVIAADGAGSVVRASLHKSKTVGATEDLLPHGYKELAIPAGSNGQFQLDPNALHIWPRGGFMLIALPNPAGDFTLTLFLPNKGETSFEALADEQSAAAFFEAHFPDAVPLIPDYAHALVNNPLGLLGTVRCSHWHDRGNVLLIGDAAHAVVPFHGQGMNLAFEDCVVLDRILKTSEMSSVDLRMSSGRTRTQLPTWRSRITSRCATRYVIQNLRCVTPWRSNSSDASPNDSSHVTQWSCSTPTFPIASRSYAARCRIRCSRNSRAMPTIWTVSISMRRPRLPSSG
jgi:kynurenine 3-monooxygenase